MKLADTDKVCCFGSLVLAMPGFTEKRAKAAGRGEEGRKKWRGRDNGRGKSMNKCIYTYVQKYKNEP